MSSMKAWNWIQDNMKIIKWTAWKMNPVGMDVRDMFQDLIMRIFLRHDQYDPDRGSPRTWIWMMARAIRTDRIRQPSFAPISDDDLSTQWGNGADILKRVEVIRIMESASDQELEAMNTVVVGYKQREIKSVIGVAYQTRDMRLKKIARRYKDYMGES